MSQSKNDGSHDFEAIGLRIRHIRKRLNLTQDELATKVGATKESISRWETGMYEPPLYAVAKLAILAPDVNTLWLLSGDGPMLEIDDIWTDEVPPPEMPTGRGGPTVRASRAPDDSGRWDEVSPIELQGLGFALIPLFAVRAGAGDERAVLSEAPVNLLAFREEWIRNELRRNPGDLFLLTVDGDSMFPTLVPGEALLVDRTGTSVTADAIYLLRVYDGIMVKRCQWNEDGLHLLSDNPAYAKRVIRREELENGVQILGRVLWGGRRY